MIINPILPGFNPDPSIIRVDDDYYIATSTFEWFPGIRIYHSKDLKNWQHINNVLTSRSQLDINGMPASKGVWAPCLSYDKEEKLYYVVFSIMKSTVNEMFDQDNYLVYSDDICGEWSEPIYLNSNGFDPSLFHDDDGKKYILNVEYDFRKGYELPQPGPIIIQEYDSTTKQLVGQMKRIYNGGTKMWCIEGPHLYKYNGYYYLMTAEGGTGYGHGVVMGRSKNILGPYESDPMNPIITSANKIYNLDKIVRYTREELYNPDSYLQKSGHGSLVETSHGEFYIAHLCSRPIMPEKRSVLGRETAIQKVIYTEDGWFRIKSGDHLALKEVESPIGIEEHPFINKQVRDYFDESELDISYNTLREPMDYTWGSLTARKGYLRLRGRESLASLYNQSLVAKRVTSYKYQVETCIEFEPTSYMHMAGLILYYDNRHYYYLRLYYSETYGCKCLGIMLSEDNSIDELRDYRIPLKGAERVYLGAHVNTRDLQFYYSIDGINFQDIGPVLDATVLSDEYKNIDKFTGSFAGICCQDLAYRKVTADFDYFEYKVSD